MLHDAGHEAVDVADFVADKSYAWILIVWLADDRAHDAGNAQAALFVLSPGRGRR